MSQDDAFSPFSSEESPHFEDEEETANADAEEDADAAAKAAAEEIFNKEIEGWAYGIAQANLGWTDEYYTLVVSVVLPCLKEPIASAIQAGYLFDILDVALQISRAAKYLVDEREIAFVLLAQFPDPAKLSPLAQATFSGVVDQMEQAYGGAVELFGEYIDSSANYKRALLQLTQMVFSDAEDQSDQRLAIQELKRLEALDELLDVLDDDATPIASKYAIAAELPDIVERRGSRGTNDTYSFFNDEEYADGLSSSETDGEDSQETASPETGARKAVDILRDLLTLAPHDASIAENILQTLVQRDAVETLSEIAQNENLPSMTRALSQEALQNLCQEEAKKPSVRVETCLELWKLSASSSALKLALSLLNELDEEITERYWLDVLDALAEAQDWETLKSVVETEGCSPIGWKSAVENLVNAERMEELFAVYSCTDNSLARREYILVDLCRMPLDDAKSEFLLDALRTALEERPLDIRLLTIYAEFCMRNGESYDAAQIMERMIEEQPRIQWALVNSGRIYVENSEPVEAIRCLNQAILLVPNDSSLLTLRGKAHYDCGEFENAVQDFQMAERVTFLDTWHRSLLANSLRSLGRLAEALQVLEFVSTEEAPSDFAYAVRAACHEEMDHMDAAISDFTAALEIDPSYRFCLIQRGILFRRKHRFEEAREDFDRAATNYSGDTQAITLRVQMSLRLGMYEQAQGDIDWLLENTQPNDFARYLNGLLQCLMGRRDDPAETSLESWKWNFRYAQSAAPEWEDDESLCHRALYRVAVGDSDQIEDAERIYQRVLSSETGLRYFRNTALPDLEDITVLFPQNLEALHLLNRLSECSVMMKSNDIAVPVEATRQTVILGMQKESNME